MTTTTSRLDSPSVGVLVPSFGRPSDLAKCLAGIAQQTMPVPQIVVVVRANDDATQRRLLDFAEYLPIHQVLVNEPGQVQAIQAGLGVIRTDCIALIDDDAVPQIDWIERIANSFRADLTVGGVGGRDIVHENGETIEGAARIVGRLTWFGNAIGNHHLGCGSPREVDLLKGANMSFRTTLLKAVGFDQRLRGVGAQVANEVGLCLRLRRDGWRLIYDPAICVDHYPAARPAGDHRNAFDLNHIHDAAFNEALGIHDNLSRLRRTVFMAWALLIGNRQHRGVLQGLRFLPHEGLRSLTRAWASMQGRTAAAWFSRYNAPARAATATEMRSSPKESIPIPCAGHKPCATNEALRNWK